MYGGKRTAYALPEDRFYAVPAKRASELLPLPAVSSGKWCAPTHARAHRQ